MQCIARPRVVSLALVATAGLASVTHADMLPINDNTSMSTNGLGHFTGSITYTFLGGTTGRLDVSLTNTTAASVGGYITAFMFRTPADMGLVTSSLSTWDNNLATNIPSGETAPPFPGSWIGGAGLTSSWLNGGSPTGGLAVGSTGSWSFAITSASASTLTAACFVADTINTDTYAFMVRFRGMNEPYDSDKVPGMDVPSPGVTALIGLSGLWARRRRG